MSGYEWDWSALWDNLPFLLEGIRLTVIASVASMAAAAILALPIALARIAGRWLGAAAQIYIELFRNVPLLVLVLWVFTVMPLLTGVTLTPLASGIVALTLNLSAFIAEIYRAGITSIAAGQTHAALAIGMTRWQLLKRIVLPQAVMRVLPALGSMWVSLFKDTSILSVIGVGELMYQGRIVSSDTYRPLEVFTGVAVIYYILAYPQALGVNWLFAKFQVKEWAVDDVLLRVEGLHKHYGTLHVLCGIDLIVRRGEVVVVIGASGSGKSSLLRCLNRLEDPSAGHIYIDGVDIVAPRVNLPVVRRNIGMVFQHFNLFPHMSALGNVAEGPRTVLRMGRMASEERALALLRKVGLGDKVNAKPAQLSGGQQQRVAIARALAMQPEIMLFDEVTSALDPELVAGVLAVMRQLAEDGMTMIVVTHEMEFARQVGDRVVVFENGVIIEEGKPNELLRNPQHASTQRFLSSLLKGDQT